MNDPRECPQCNGRNTRVVHTENDVDYIEKIRVCEDCPVEYVVSYSNPTLIEARDEDGNAIEL